MASSGTREVRVGDRIRILKDFARGANVRKGDQFAVKRVYFNSKGDRIVVTEDYGWHFYEEDYEISEPSEQDTDEAMLKVAQDIAAEPDKPEPPEDDAVFRPAHYARYAIEPITFITANQLPFLVGNVIKYVMRYDAKNGLEDLRKARRYIDILIEDVERRERGEAIRVPAV